MLIPPALVSAARATIGMVALPAILGTAIVLLIFLPLPSAFVYGRVAESSFWIAAAVGPSLVESIRRTAVEGSSWVGRISRYCGSSFTCKTPGQWA